MITIFTTSRYTVHKPTLAGFTQKLMHSHQLDSYDVNIIFVGKRKMRSIASTYGHGDVAKPVLTFGFKHDEMREDGPLLGEIYICYPQAILLASEKGKTVDAMLEFLIDHGIKNLINND